LARFAGFSSSTWSSLLRFNAPTGMGAVEGKWEGATYASSLEFMMIIGQ
jgi:hypothetical protein